MKLATLPFQWAAGRILGTDHAVDLLWGNNQDATAIRQSGDVFVAVIADGCSNGNEANPSRNEVGANLGANLFAQNLLEFASAWILNDSPKNGDLFPYFEDVRLKTLESLRSLVHSMVGSSMVGTPLEAKMVIDHFLFTIVGVLVTPFTTIMFTIGDGMIVFNETVIPVGPFPGNTPPLMAYSGLVRSSIDPEMCKVTIHISQPTDQVNNLLIGSDGVMDLIRAEHSTYPGKKILVGPLSQFWRDNAYFANPDQVRRKLALMNLSAVKIDWDQRTRTPAKGLLHDDTTLFVLRRVSDQQT